MALAGRPDELGSLGIAIVGSDPPADAGRQPGQVFGISARSIHELDPDTPRPAGLDDTTVGNA